MKNVYALQDTSKIFSPALLFYPEFIRQNIARAIDIVGNPARLRPHVKTHKTREVVRLKLAANITRFKCATLAEAEMTAECGAPDVLLAYPLVGPNIDRLARLAAAFPQCNFSVLADHIGSLAMLSQALQVRGAQVEVLLDIDVGQHRTGISPNEDAVTIYEYFHKFPGIQPGGIHAYDGHNQGALLSERQAEVRREIDLVLTLRTRLIAKGLQVPRMVLGGTPTFPIFGRLDLPGLECSPGTCFLHDHAYEMRFPDLTGFTPAAILFTRVISCSQSNRLTLDLGYKAVASDPPPGQRCCLLNVGDYQAVFQNEEHFVIETLEASRFQPGDEIYAIPTHICPTCALHQSAYIVEDGQVIDRWQIAARDRVLRF